MSDRPVNYEKPFWAQLVYMGQLMSCLSKARELCAEEPYPDVEFRDRLIDILDEGDGIYDKAQDAVVALQR